MAEGKESNCGFNTIIPKRKHYTLVKVNFDMSKVEPIIPNGANGIFVIDAKPGMIP